MGGTFPPFSAFETEEMLNWVSLAVQLAAEICTRMISTSMPRFLHGCWGQTQAFMLAQQALYEMCHLTSCLITVVDGFHNLR